MHSWFKVNLGDAMLVDETLSDLKACLSNIYEQEGRPESMLAIYRHESEGLHCNLIVYLTAELQRAAMIEDAVSCNTPSLSDSGFLVGASSLPTQLKRYE